MHNLITLCNEDQMEPIVAGDSLAHTFARHVQADGLGYALIKSPPKAHRNHPDREMVILIFEDNSEFGFFFNQSFWTKGVPG